MSSADEPAAPEPSAAPEPAAEPPERSTTRIAVAAAAVVVVLVAVVITVGRSQVDGYGPAQHQSASARAATAGRQLGTTCVGWPGDLMPSASVEDRPGAVSLVGGRDRFQLRNPGPDPVVVEITVEGGKVVPTEGGSAEDDQTARFELSSGADGAFTASCGTRQLTATVAEPADVGFVVASGEVPSPAVFVKARSGE